MRSSEASKKKISSPIELPLPIIHRCFKISLVFIFCCSGIVSAAEGLSVHVVDVSYADAIVLNPHADAVCLIDTGGEESSRKLIEYLKSLDVKRIDKVILTHGHENHYGGVSALSGAFEVGEVYINPAGSGDEGYEPFLKTLDEKGINVSQVQAGQRFSCVDHDIHLDFFLPVLSRSDAYSVNDNALVTLLTFKKISFLLTSDVGENVQEILLEQQPFLKNVSVVQVPHHGKALSERLMTDMKGKIFFVSTGANPWGMPNETALARLEGTLYRTDQQGTIVFDTDGETIKVRLVP